MHRKRIARGARWLDKEFPGWHERVFTGRLNLGCPYDCVLGQVTGNFEETWSRRFFVPEWAMEGLRGLLWPPSVVGMIQMVRLGFGVGRETDEQWRAAWTEEIEARQPLFVPPTWNASPTPSVQV